METRLRGGVDRTGDGEGGSHENGTRQILSRSRRIFGPGAEGVRRCDGGAFIGDVFRSVVPDDYLHFDIKTGNGNILAGVDSKDIVKCSAQTYDQAST